METATRGARVAQTFEGNRAHRCRGHALPGGETRPEDLARTADDVGAAGGRSSSARSPTSPGRRADSSIAHVGARRVQTVTANVRGGTSRASPATLERGSRRSVRAAGRRLRRGRRHRRRPAGGAARAPAQQPARRGRHRDAAVGRVRRGKSAAAGARESAVRAGRRRAGGVRDRWTSQPGLAGGIRHPVRHRDPECRHADLALRSSGAGGRRARGDGRPPRAARSSDSGPFS